MARCLLVGRPPLGGSAVDLLVLILQLCSCFCVNGCCEKATAVTRIVNITFMLLEEGHIVE